MKQKRLFIIANWMQGEGLSGGDRIFIELSKRWSRRINIRLLVSRDGWNICKREGMENFSVDFLALDHYRKWGYLIDYVYRTIIGIWKTQKLKLETGDVIYSASDFWPDIFPAFILKLKHKEVRWIAGFYLFAAQPWHKEFPYRGWKFLTGFFYWLSQQPSYWITKKYADAIFVTSEPDLKKFEDKHRAKRLVIVVHGGVDIRHSENFLTSEGAIPVEKRCYDACFVGRFHHQKGVLELIDIWKAVSQKLPQAKLAIIGNGPLEAKIAEKIAHLKLEKNIFLMGFMDGAKKFEIFKQSKIVVHPAIYDSGGMAAAEAMAWSLPGVSFDLEALKTYYPRGMVKAPVGDIGYFAFEILRLLSEQEHYKTMSKEAHDYILSEWDWNKRAVQILERLNNSIFTDKPREREKSWRILQ